MSQTKQWKKVKKTSQNVKTANANIQLAGGLFNNLAKNMLTLRRIQICLKSSCNIMIL